MRILGKLCGAVVAMMFFTVPLCGGVAFLIGPALDDSKTYDIHMNVSSIEESLRLETRYRVEAGRVGVLVGVILAVVLAVAMLIFAAKDETPSYDYRPYRSTPEEARHRELVDEIRSLKNEVAEQNRPKK